MEQAARLLVQASRLLHGGSYSDGAARQANRQRFTEHLRLFFALQLEHFFHHANPMSGYRHRIKNVQHALAMAVIDIQSPLAAAAGELR